MRPLENVAALTFAIPGGEAACWTQTELILNSPPFCRSQRMRSLLRFLVSETLEGRAAQLKEYTIAISVFDRPPSFDPGASAVVRVEARRLRQLLSHYRRDYGAADEIEVVVPKGSYVPVFRRCSGAGGQARQSFPSDLADHRVLRSEARRPVSVIACRVGKGVEQQKILAACKSVVQRNGGMIERGACGAIAIYVGWPMSLASGPQMALGTALDLLSAYAALPGVQIGIATCEVEAACTPSDPETCDILRQTLDLAERLSGQAPRDAVMISELTRRLTRAPSTILRSART